MHVQGPRWANGCTLPCGSCAVKYERIARNPEGTPAGKNGTSPISGAPSPSASMPNPVSKRCGNGPSWGVVEGTGSYCGKRGRMVGGSFGPGSYNVRAVSE